MSNKGTEETVRGIAIFREDFPLTNIELSTHALLQFKTRWQEFYGIPLKDDRINEQVQILISNSDVENDENNSALKKRKQRYGSSDYYLINDPWRFVISRNGRLITCEIAPSFLEEITNPIIPHGQTKPCFLVFIQEREKEKMTYLKKIAPSSGFSTLPNSEFYAARMPEVNAIIRFLRGIGCEVFYKRIDSVTQKTAIVELWLPRDIANFSVNSASNERTLFINLNVSHNIPLGTKRFKCVGMSEKSAQEIWDFLNSEEWFQALEQFKTDRVFSKSRDELPLLGFQHLRVCDQSFTVSFHGRLTSDGWIMEGRVEVGSETIRVRATNKIRKNAKDAVMEKLSRSLTNHLKT